MLFSDTRLDCQKRQLNDRVVLIVLIFKMMSNISVITCVLFFASVKIFKIIEKYI